MTTEKQRNQQQWAWRRRKLRGIKQNFKTICSELELPDLEKGLHKIVDEMNLINDDDARKKGVDVKYTER